MFGAFGQQNNTGTAAPTGGLFGQPQPQQQQQPATNIFGTTAQSQPTTSLFGATATNNPTGQTGNAQGQTQPGNAFSGFGTQQTGTTGGGLFGSTTQPAPAVNTGGLFGAPAGIQQQQQTGANPFGAPATQQQTGTNLFGNAQQAQPQNGTSLFGNAQTQQNQTTGTTGGLFGSAFGANKPTITTNLFGSTTQPPAPQPTQNAGTSLFGQQQPANQTNIFGQSQQPTNTLFGASTTTNLLSGTSPNTLGNSTLGVSALGPSRLLPTRGPLVNSQADPQTQFIQLAQRIEATAKSWDTSSPDCKFQHYFYNLVDPSQVGFYGRPPNATNEELWHKAVRENPDPKCLVPALAVGFDDLRTRVEAQSQQASAHQEKLKELKDRLNALSQRHAVSNASRLSRTTAAQRQITQRLLVLVQHLHLLIPSLRSSAFTSDEEQLRMKLEGIEEDIRRGRAQSRLNELWALLGSINAARRNSVSAGGEWAVVDEEGLAQISQILSEQQAGLAHLTSILQKDLKDLGVIMGTESESSDLSHSTNNLRGSALR